MTLYSLFKIFFIKRAMDNRKLSRRARERLAQRQAMLDAALELFSAKGYRNVSMHEIAARGEFAIGTLYKFFKNKEDLYKAMLLETSYKFRDVLTKAITEPVREIEKLRNYVRIKGQLFRANAPMIRLYFVETQGAEMNVMAGVDATIRRERQKFLRSMAAIFESGLKKRHFKRIASPFHLAVALDSLTNAYLFLWLENPGKHPYPEDPDEILNILFKGLTAE
jgi:TetR/AcrR family transcriptional regulator